VSSHPVAVPASLAAAGAWLRRVRDGVQAVRTAYVLAVFVVVQWLALLAFALTVRHNGWLYYAGGDQLWHYSGAYFLSQGDLPPTYVGYGWSMLLLPIAAFAGPNLVSALPALVLLNTLVLLPVALLCVYGIASRIAGRLFGYWAAALWIALPYLGILFLERGYHQKYTELTLPQLLGLTSVPDFPAMVALLVSGYFCLRALDSPHWYSAALAGLAAGYSIAIKPSNSIFLFAPALTLLALRWRALLPFGAALAPALLTLALWKYRGLGELAAAPADPVRVAGVDDLLRRIHNPSDLNSWEHLHQVLLGLREHFWVSRVMVWLPVAGTLALLLRSRRGFFLVATWFTVFLLVKGTYIPASVDDASIFRILMPAFPAYVLLAAAVVLLVPGLRARPAPRPFAPTGRRLTVAFAAPFLLFAALPLGVLAATPQLHDGGSRAVRLGGSLLPIEPAIKLRATVHGNDVRLSWDPPPTGPASRFYRVLRGSGPGGGLGCAGALGSAADDCQLYMESPGVTRAPIFVDRPGRGNWTYRIGIAANWVDDERLGDVYVLSPPVRAGIP
jgi:hypothetical protein